MHSHIAIAATVIRVPCGATALVTMIATTTGTGTGTTSGAGCGGETE